MRANEKIAVAVSGGVDSAVCVKLLKDQSRDVMAMHMTNWQEDSFSPCTSSKDLDDARQVAEKLGVKFFSLNFSKEYKERVFSHFLDEYQKGNTPNPDILCNSEIKFSVLFNKARESGADILATGHYARVVHTNGRIELHQAVDKDKDQSYFLYRLNQEILKNVVFPLGEIKKKQTRQIALKQKLHVHNKKDSTGICFIGEKNFRPFLATYLGKKQGEIRCLDTDVLLGEHDGHYLYTVGQRNGFGIGGVKGRLNAPWYVARKDPALNRVYVVQGDHPSLYHKELIATDISWLDGIDELDAGELHSVSAKIRYRQANQKCFVHSIKQGKKNKIRVVFEEKQRAIAQGQSCVIYDGTRCLGGAIIERAI